MEPASRRRVWLECHQREKPVLYTVGYRINETSEHVTLEAEDALEAAKFVKSEHPKASITYSRAANHEERDSEDVAALGA